MITIREWMNNKTILITGGAGFMGKVLIEKLLRSCPGVNRIYLIIRSKGGKTPQERWASIIKDKLFEKLLTNAPDILEEKVTVLDGDMSLIDLGLSAATIEELKIRVNIIFHSAATVQFNDPLHKAIFTNVRGTLEMCKLASKMNNLEVFVHVSTAFCNHNLMKSHYEEKIYEPCQDWKTILKLIETENPAVMNTLSYKIIQDHPNTYTFTKSLSEKIVEEYSCEFPTVITRPSIVIGVLVDPVPGWADNMNGIIGLSAAICKGVIRVGKGIDSVILDCISIDVATNAMIICAWDKAISENKELSVCNCADNNLTQISIVDLVEKGTEMINKEYTLDNDIWYPFFLTVTNEFYFRILFFLLNVIPAVLIDSILFLMKMKTRLIKITIKVYNILQALESFMTKQVTFESKKYKALWGKLTQEEAEIFYVREPAHIKTMYDVILINLKGIKEYVLKESLEETEYHRVKLRRLYYLHCLARGILVSALLITIYKLANTAISRYL